MTTKVTLEYDGEVPQEIQALEQLHNAGKPAHEGGYHEPDRAAWEPLPGPDTVDSEHLAQHPEDFQHHNAGRPAVETGGGQEVCVKMEWDPDPGKH